MRDVGQVADVPDDLGMVGQHFEHFFAPPGSGTGETFDREARFQGFRDIGRMFGNPIMGSGPDGGVLPLGVPASELMRTDAQRCSTPVVLGGATASMDQRFYDDEYNPDGRYPVITFCDGGRSPVDVGTWNGSVGGYPVEITMAVDRNANGRRDAGEPVIRNFSEPYRDVGNDRLANRDEPGYDAATNPDPSGDDYDRQYNPSGTETNYLRDAMEPYDDSASTAWRAPPRRMSRTGGGGIAARRTARLATYIDGGVRFPRCSSRSTPTTSRARWRSRTSGSASSTASPG